MGIAKSVGRVVLVFAVAAVAAAAGWALFLAYPVDLTDLFGVVLAVGVAAAGLRAGVNLAGSLFPDYNVAEVAVEGPISRDGGGSAVPPSPGGAGADDVVEQIERADADRNATCASGGYEIAAGCDELWAREGSIVGSIGVVGSRVNAADLADRLGVSYEQFTAGRFKDAGVPLKELEEEEREYLQTLVDDYYDQFVAGVVEGRDLAEETVRETEARVYLGSEAADLGLVDELGTPDWRPARGLRLRRRPRGDADRRRPLPLRVSGGRSPARGSRVGRMT